MTVDQLWGVIGPLALLCFTLVLKIAELKHNLKLAEQREQQLVEKIQNMDTSVDYQEVEKSDPIEHQNTYPKLDNPTEKILLNLAHKRKYIHTQDVAFEMDDVTPAVLHRLETLQALHYVLDHFDAKGKGWSCSQQGRAYLAHHNLI